jgi:hypothetical protein
MASKKPKQWRIYLLRERATYVATIEAADQKAAIAKAQEELSIPSHLRGKISAEPA